MKCWFFPPRCMLLNRYASARAEAASHTAAVDILSSVAFHFPPLPSSPFAPGADLRDEGALVPFEGATPEHFVDKPRGKLLPAPC